MTNDPRRPIDHAPSARKHVGPYYGPAAWKRIIEHEDPPSIIERLVAYWESLSTEVQIVFVAGIVASVFFAALIVVTM